MPLTRKKPGMRPAPPGICVRYGRHQVPPISLLLPAAAPSSWTALHDFSDAAATRLFAALRPKKLQEEVRRMMISATDGLDEWTVSQLDKFAIRLDRIASEEALWNSTIQADTGTSRGAPPTTRGGETRVYHNCGKPGHIALDCRSKPRAGNAATNMRPANASANQCLGPCGLCYHCHQMGHVDAECPDRQPGGKLARHEHGKPWCEHHRVN
jgi:hypothetical protein